MSDNIAVFKPLSKAGGAMGRGFIAGFAGTLAMTLAQLVGMKVTGRGMSTMSADVGGKVKSTPLLTQSIL